MHAIPVEESRVFGAFVERALALGHNGWVLEGYQVLDLGIALAEAAQEQGEGWAEPLLDRYRLALVRYSETFPQDVREVLAGPPTREALPEG
jgi:hypothetical protein